MLELLSDFACPVEGDGIGFPHDDALTWMMYVDMVL